MLKLKEALVVEGRYDKNTLAQIVDAPIFVTNGFGIFKDPETLSLLRAAAEHRGLILLTDSDGAGFVIRNYLKGAIPPERLKHAYVPDVYGKERRKAAPGREGKLGVEGMPPEILIRALLDAGATVLDRASAAAGDGTITKTDLYALGLSGRPDSKSRRLALQRRLGLPEHLSTNALLTALNVMYPREEFLAMAEESEKENAI